MAMAQFAMVEELALLIKDNLSCKHIVLSMEEAFINFLQNDTSSDTVLELEPMSPYHRLLLHRLAEIYGFAHESVGEGSDRHLILERCPDSSIPSVLVSDILWQYDGYQTPSIPQQLLKRKDALPALKMNQASLPPSASLEEREAAYMAARDRIFSLDEGEMKEPVPPKQRNVPVVARRMIAHALGQRISSNLLNDNLESAKNRVNEGPSEMVGSIGKSEVNVNLDLKPADGAASMSSQHSSTRVVSMTQSESKGHNEVSDYSSTSTGLLHSGIHNKPGDKDNLKREHLGAAKRIFAHALGLPSTKQNPGLLSKCNEASNAHSQEVGDRLKT